MKEEERPPSGIARRDTQGKQTLEIHRLGPHPIIQHVLDHLGVARILDKHIHSNRESSPSHGATIALLVHNVLLCRDPLYRIPSGSSRSIPGRSASAPRRRL